MCFGLLLSLSYNTRHLRGLAFVQPGRDRLNAFIRRCVKLGYRDKSAPFIEHIFGQCDDQLLSRIKLNTNSLHILQQYLPDRSTLNYSLHPRRHNKTLITKTSDLLMIVILLLEISIKIYIDIQTIELYVLFYS